MVVLQEVTELHLLQNQAVVTEVAHHREAVAAVVTGVVAAVVVVEVATVVVLPEVQEV